MKILILGQIPPPYGGQAINIEKMIQILHNQGIAFHFIKIDFSREINDMGRFSIRKLRRLFYIFIELVWRLCTYQPEIVYYPPAGPQRIPILRDMVLLLPVRLFRCKIIFHFHAGGISEMYSKFNFLLQTLYRVTYFNATYAICLSEEGKKDPLFLKSKHIHVINSGVEDIGYPIAPAKSEKFIVLFVGLCSESKGVIDYIKAIREAREQCPNIYGIILGKIFSPKEEYEILKAVEQGIINYKGIQTGELKNQNFRTANVLLFPSFFESENFPTVIIEAFAAGIPVIASKWRGIRDQVKDGHNGFLHDVHDISGMADSLIHLANNADKYRQLSINARHDFETKYTMDMFATSIINFYKSLG